MLILLAIDAWRRDHDALPSTRAEKKAFAALLAAMRCRKNAEGEGSGAFVDEENFAEAMTKCNTIFRKAPNVRTVGTAHVLHVLRNRGGGECVCLCVCIHVCVCVCVCVSLCACNVRSSCVPVRFNSIAPTHHSLHPLLLQVPAEVQRLFDDPKCDSVTDSNQVSARGEGFRVRCSCCKWQLLCG